MRRRVVCASVYVRVGGADHVERFVLDFVHQPRGRRRAGVGDAVPVSLFVVGARVVHRMVLGGEVVNLGLVVVVVVTGAFDDVRRVVSRAGYAARGEGDTTHRRVQQGFL